MAALKYEGFIRGAFALKDSNMIERGEDPARLAEAGLWNMNDLNRVKVGVAYALEIYSTKIKEILSDEKSHDAVSRDLERLLDQTIKATNLKEISKIIDDVKEYQNKYIL